MIGEWSQERVSVPQNLAWRQYDLTFVLSIGGAALGFLLLSALWLYLAGRRLARRPAYSRFLRLNAFQKLAFFKRILTDSRTPLWVKAMPALLALYLASPIDLVPDFIPVLGYVDDVALALLVFAALLRFTPEAAIRDAMERARGGHQRTHAPRE